MKIIISHGSVKNARVGFTLLATLTAPLALAGTDEYFAKQWPLNASGQSFRRDVDDITSETVVAKAGSDIHWQAVVSRLNGIMKRDAVVAVLDSGVDLDHPDLAANIFRNTKECTAAGKIDPLAREDRDGNGFVGDCMGWNFAASGAGNPRTYDSAGHGTHVAGIIAAIGNNGIGITGVAQKIKILPVRIIETDANVTELPPRTDIFARGIRYAADMKVDVINMSLGWPLSMQTTELKNAVNYALSKGITLVAAAGNNGHDNPTFPCALDGVICVGAISPNNTLAPFSNFGGAVDLVAPGEFIYSLFPGTLRPIVSGVQGYEVKNGTSQAAPFVSAAAAILRATYPRITNSEIHARLVAGANAIDNDNTKRPTLHGKLNLESAIFGNPQVVAEPSFKDLVQVGFQMQTKQFSFALPIKNFWIPASEVKVKFSVPTGSIVLNKSEFIVGNMPSGATSVLNISGKIVDAQAHSEVPIAVEVSSTNGGSKTFRSTLFFSRQLTNDPALKRVALPTISGFSLTDPSGNSLMRTIGDSFRYSETPEYYAIASAQNSIRIAVLRMANASASQLTHAGTLEIAGATRILNIVMVDANGDGSREYMIQSLAMNSGKPGMRLSWFDGNLRPLYGNKSEWNIAIEGAALSGNFAFLRANDPTLGKVALPVFAENGSLPSNDRFNDPLGTSDGNGATKHLYFINPTIQNDTIVAQTRVLDTNAAINEMRKQMNSGDEDAVLVSALFPQSRKDLDSGELNALFVSGNRGNSKPFVVKFTGYEQFSITEVNAEGADLTGNVTQALRSLQGPTVDFAGGLSFISQFGPYSARTISIVPRSNHSTIAPITAQQFDYANRGGDSLLAGLGTFEENGRSYVFYQSKQRLLMQHVIAGKEQARFELPIYRYSFIPGTVFNQLFYPVSYHAGNTSFAAFYTDNSAINRNSAQLVVGTNTGLTRPMNMSIALPENCQSMNPARIGSQGTFSFVFLCGKELRMLPMGL